MNLEYVQNIVCHLENCQTIQSNQLVRRKQNGVLFHSSQNTSISFKPLNQFEQEKWT